MGTFLPWRKPPPGGLHTRPLSLFLDSVRRWVHAYLGWRPPPGGLHTRPLGLIVELIFLLGATTANLAGGLYSPPGGGGRTRGTGEVEPGGFRGSG